MSAGDSGRFPPTIAGAPSSSSRSGRRTEDAMSVHEPPPDEAPEPEPAPEPHGLAEEIKHEIEEVVEHVPKPIRWTVGKLVRLVVLGLIGLVVVLVVTAILYVVNRTEWAAQELAILVNQALVSRSDVAIEIGDIKGNPFTGVRVLKPRVRFRDGDQPLLMDAAEMRLRYSAWDLATGGRRAIEIEIDQPLFHVARGPDRKIRLPRWKSGQVRGDRGLDLVIRIHRGTVVSPDTAVRVHGLELDALARTGPQARLEVRSMTWGAGPWGSVLERCALELSQGDSTRVRVKELRTHDLTLRGQMAWQPGGDAVVHLEFDRLVWRWLHRVTGRDDVNVPGTGHLVIDAVGHRTLAGRFHTDGVWDSLAVQGQGGFTWRDGRLVIAPLTGHTLAGDLTGTVTWTKSAWEISADVKHGDPSRWWIIGIHNWPAGDLNGRFKYAVDTRRPKHAARLAARLAGSQWTGWHADSGLVAVEFTPIGPDSFQVLAHRHGGTMRLRARTDATGWKGDYELNRFPLDEWPEGRSSALRGAVATGRGTAGSHRGDLQITGAIEGGVTDWLGIHTARWRMSEIRGSLLPAPNLDGNVHLEDLFFLTVHWDSAGVPIHVGDGRVALPELHVAAGDTTLHMEARAEWDPNGWRFIADAARIRSSQFDWTADPPMVISGDPHAVHFDRLLAQDRDARLTIDGRWAGPGGSYDWTARTERLDLGRLGFPREWRLAGSGEGRLHISGVAGDPRWELSGIARGAGMGDVHTDSLRLAVGGGPARVEVRDAVAFLGGGSVSLSGEVDGTSKAWPDTLTGVGITRWLADAARWNGEVRATQVPLERVGRLGQGKLAWRGQVGGTLDIGGRPSDPDLNWNVQARPLAYGDYRVDEGNAHGRYRDGKLDVGELRMTRQGVNSAVHGTLPLKLALGERAVVPDLPMDWQFDVPSGDLALLPVFVPQIGAAAGHFDVSARLQGTAQRPRLSGTAHIKDGRARMAGREEVLDGIQADLTLSDTLITLDKLTARQSKAQGTPGQVTGVGVVNIAGLALKGYRFDLHLKDFTAKQSGVYAGLFDGDFVVTPGSRVKGVVLPLVEGNLELRQAVVLFDFANQSQVDQVASSTQELFWLYRIQLNATDNLRWKPPDADIEFSADLRLEQSPDSLIIYGDMTSIRGNYYYLSNKFTMDRVNLTFDNIGGVDPKLDIAGWTQVPQTAGEQNPAGTRSGSVKPNPNPVTIHVAITGRAAEPIMAFTSVGAENGEWDQPSILMALTYGPWRETGSRTEAGERLADDWVTRNLNRQLSTELSRVFQGYLGDWELARESGGLLRGEGDVILGVNTQLARNLNLRYRQRVPGFAREVTNGNSTANSFERDVEAQYRLNRFFYVSTEVTQRRHLSGSTEARPPEYNLSLKARWEY